MKKTSPFVPFLIMYTALRKEKQDIQRNKDYRFNIKLDIKNLYKCVDWYKANPTKELKGVDFEQWGNEFVLLTTSICWTIKEAGFSTLTKNDFNNLIIKKVTTLVASIVNLSIEEVKRILKYYLNYLDYIEKNKMYPILFKEEKRYADKALEKYMDFYSKMNNEE